MESEKIISNKSLLNYLIFSGILFANTINDNKSSAKTQENIDIPDVDSYRSALCIFCKKWINHLRDNGLEVADNKLEDVSEIKKYYQIPNSLKTCNSAKKGKYTIKGHVPIESINKLFKEKPSFSGIAFPGMPHGSPGIEIHSHESHSNDYESYEVVSFSKNGKPKIFEKISP